MRKGSRPRADDLVSTFAPSCENVSGQGHSGPDAPSILTRAGECSALDV